MLIKIVIASEKLSISKEIQNYFQNMNWIHHNYNIKEKLSEQENASCCNHRKIDVELTLVNLKANLGFTIFSVRGKQKVYNELSIVLIATNMRKYSALRAGFHIIKIKTIYIQYDNKSILASLLFTF